jgi:ubiquinone/menaquinone biosynthesis C-methylase UbiE
MADRRIKKMMDNKGHTPATIDLLQKVLRCPSCHSSITVTPDSWACDVCERKGTIDSDRITHLFEEDHHADDKALREFFEKLKVTSNCCNMERIGRAVRAIGGEFHELITGYTLLSDYGGLALALTGEDTISLDFGCGWGNITRAISHFRGTVFSLDSSYGRLLFAKSLSTNKRELFIQCGKQYPLPFADSCFDFIFLHDVLQRLPEDFMMNMTPLQVQTMLLKEFLRILKPNGRIIVRAENWNSYKNWIGEKDQPVGRYFSSILRRVISNIYTIISKSEKSRVCTYTRQGYYDLLINSGFRDIRCYVPWCGYTGVYLFDKKQINAYPIVTSNTRDSALRKLQKRFVKVLQYLDILDIIASDYYIAASKTRNDDASFAKSLIETVLENEHDDMDRFPVVRTSTGFCLLFATKSKFYKIPLTESALQSLFKEMDALNEVRSTSLNPYIVPWSHCSRIKGICYGVYAAIKAKENIDTDEYIEKKGQKVGRFLYYLNRDSKLIELESTDFWKRLCSNEMNRCIAYLYSPELLPLICDVLRRKKAKSGIVHGDLWHRNVVLSYDDNIYVVDWDWFERLSPKFLDIVHFCVRYIQIAHGKSFREALWLFCKNRQLDEINEVLWSVSGDLSRDEMVTLYILDRISKDMSAFPAFLSSANTLFKEYRDALAVCESWFK